ncbi:MAG: hypothetical protein AAF193_09430, partial [Bacteroidota bacterium]
MIKDKMYLRRGFADAAQFILLLLLISIFQSSLGQGAPTQVEDSTSMTLPNVQGIPLLNDSLSTDSIATPSESDVIDASVFYDSEDSIVFDLLNGKVLLYGNAIVKYDGLEVKAEYIEYDFANTMACATVIIDSTGVMTGKPQLSDDGQNFTQEYMCYNFKTKEGFSKVSVTQDGDAVFHAEVSKRHSNEWIHIKRGMFTTCDADTPHYHFRLSKAIIVPDEKVVSGPLYMKVGKVP